ncbi:MAG: DnaK suppressor protein [Frankiaceae bacterium]|nr:DnaK suppressor protein [Frankiaceae bacterium]
MDQAAARRRLSALLAEIDSSSATLLAEHGDPGELSHIDQHSAEAATDLSEVEREETVRTIVAGQRQEVLAALARLDAGTYGVCVECGQPLPEERLDARPEAARCVNCQHDLEMAR